MEKNFLQEVPRMESIKKTAEIFGLPVHFIREKVASGEIVAVKAGNKNLVNVDKLAEYLNTSTIQPKEKPTVSGNIAPIGVKGGVKNG